MDGWGSQLHIVDGVTAGYITPSSPLGGNCVLLQPSEMFSACPSAGTSAQGSDEVASGTWWPRAGTGRDRDHQNQETKRGWTLPKLCPGLSKLCWFKCHPSKHLQPPWAQTTGLCSLLLCALQQGGPGSGIIPRMGSMQSVHASAGLIRLRGSP